MRRQVLEQTLTPISNMNGSVPICYASQELPSEYEPAGAILAFQGWKFLCASSTKLKAVLELAAEQRLSDLQSLIGLSTGELGRFIACMLRVIQRVLVASSGQGAEQPELYLWTKTRRAIAASHEEDWPHFFKKLSGSNDNECEEDVFTRQYLCTALATADNAPYGQRSTWHDVFSKGLSDALPLPNVRDQVFHKIVTTSHLWSKHQWEVLTLWFDLLTASTLCHISGSECCLRRVEALMGHVRDTVMFRVAV
ncbi:hypothetical protein HIM_09101 [Hirsutella minnesotensis 3608]|uniref:Uncharacterized protein n=1 Tax=Hirsutella minnesotensis 3608 TaxID=1043627 RepID=A0A0F7ZSK3_9HYPO|nr:hypothetical protein HIM_09101 [Hirsutella minnesotensis 3608]